MLIINLIILVASLGCMGGCAISDKLSLEIFFGFIFIAATIRLFCQREDN